MKNSIKVTILPHNKTQYCQYNSKLIDVIFKCKVNMDAVCGGKGKCGKCKIKILSGELSERTYGENKLLSKEEIDSNIVLACERRILSDIVIETINKKEESLGKGIIKKNTYEINPIVKKKYLELVKPSLNDQRSDIERIINELKLKCDDETIDMDINLIRELNKVLRENNYTLTTTLFNNEITYIKGGNTKEKHYGIATDIGTTTIASYLIDFNSGKIIDVKSELNLQKQYGADVLSRINYSLEREENKEVLRQCVIKTIDKTIYNLINSNKIDIDNISIVSMVGNTTMSHLLIGADVYGISKAPFNPVFSDKIEGKIDYLGLSSLNKNTRFILLPNIGGYVGSDTLAAIIGSNIDSEKGNILLIDIGTNCELALKTQKEVLVCSTAAGPAFEGANMKHGMRATKGAIYACEIDDDIYVKTIGNDLENKVDPSGICGSGYINIISKLLEHKILKPQGRIVKVDELGEDISSLIKNRINKDGKWIELFLSDKVSITQEDISNLQLSKSAIRTGIELLMKEAKIENLDKILLCGAFGSNLDINSLKNIKMIPNIENSKIEVMGNAAGKGGIDILLNKSKYKNIEELLNKIKHVELANHKNFNNVYASNLKF